MRFKAQENILPEAQKELWPLLREVPNNFVLYGGTAVALRYGHRQSVDFDFFTSMQYTNLYNKIHEIPFINKLNSTTKKVSDHHIEVILQTKKGEVNITFLNDRNIIAASINPPDIITENMIKIASSVDLMACKILALHNRTAAKDYIDIAELINHGTSLQKGFEASFAIAKLSPLGENQLMLDKLKEELKSKSVKQIIASYFGKEDNEKITNICKILYRASEEINLEKISRTRLKAVQCIERTANQILMR
jgi:predicted nucleotidyltransferase component of viral defense system